MVKTVLMFLYCSSLRYWMSSIGGMRPVCQSLQWMTSGTKSISGRLSSTARQK